MRGDLGRARHYHRQPSWQRCRVHKVGAEHRSVFQIAGVSLQSTKTYWSLKLKRLFVTAAMLAVTTVAAQAADITIKHNKCLPKEICNVIIKINGDIKLEDFKKFEDVITFNNIKLAVVNLNSNGGNLLSGLSVGTIIANHGFDTYVADNAFCVSVCAAIWISGSKRYATPTSKIGFHKPYFLDGDGQKHTDLRVIEFTKDYYLKMGVPRSAANYFVSADPNDVSWLEANMANEFGIKISYIYNH